MNLTLSTGVPADLAWLAAALALVATVFGALLTRWAERPSRIVALACMLIALLLTLTALAKRGLALDRAPLVTPFEVRAAGAALLLGCCLVTSLLLRATKSLILVCGLGAALLLFQSAEAAWVESAFFPALHSHWTWIHPVSFALGTAAATLACGLLLARDRRAGDALDVALGSWLIGLVSGFGWVHDLGGKWFPYDSLESVTCLVVAGLVGARCLHSSAVRPKRRAAAAVLTLLPLLSLSVHWHLPESQRSLHRFIDDAATHRELDDGSRQPPSIQRQPGVYSRRER